MVNQFYSHVSGPYTEFLGNPEDCGYKKNQSGQWTDFLGNSGELRTRKFQSSDKHLLKIWFCGDDNFNPELLSECCCQAQLELGLDFAECYKACQDLARESLCLLKNQK